LIACIKATRDGSRFVGATGLEPGAFWGAGGVFGVVEGVGDGVGFGKAEATIVPKVEGAVCMVLIA